MITVSLLKGCTGSAQADTISKGATMVLYSSAVATHSQAEQCVLAWFGFSFAFRPLLLPHKEEKAMTAERGEEQNLPSYPETG